MRKRITTVLASLAAAAAFILAAAAPAAATHADITDTEAHTNDVISCC
jgi:hypothetical protein